MTNITITVWPSKACQIWQWLQWVWSSKPLKEASFRWIFFIQSRQWEISLQITESEIGNSPWNDEILRCLANYLTIGVHKHTCYHFSSLDLGALIPRTWHKPTVAVSKPSLCKKRCCVIHVRVGWSTSMLYRSYFAAIWASHALQDKIWNEINQTHSSYRVYGWLLAY